MPRAPLLLLLSLACLLLNGCRHLPDPKAFVDSTQALRAAVRSSGDTTLAELQRARALSEENQARLEAATAALAVEWQKRNEAMAALVVYARSLEEIAAAGKSSGESAKQVLASAKTLATSLGLPDPGGGAVAAVTGAAEYVWAKLGEQIAASSLEKSLAAVDPAIKRIAVKLRDDLAETEKQVKIAARFQRADLDWRHKTRLGYRDQLLRNREALLGTLTAKLAETERIAAVLFPPPDQPVDENARSTMLGAVAQRDDAAAEVRKLDALLAATADWHAAYSADRQAIDDHERTALEIVAAARAGFSAWADAHGDLLAAVRAKRLPSAAELAAEAERIQSLVQQFRELRKPRPSDS